jgi:lipopolysaccharide biosynthesis glycosyltransferase
LGHQALAAVPEAWEMLDKRMIYLLGSSGQYFNAGVLLINLEFWRQSNVYENSMAFIMSNTKKMDFWDQDALNAILVHRWIELPPHWNAQYEYLKRNPSSNPAIVHFTGDIKPWHWSPGYLFEREYRMYRRKTPWPQYRLEGKPPFARRAWCSFRRKLRSTGINTLAKACRKW